jgi:hypothetical protein
VFSMAANGMKTFSGITVGIIGGYIGIHLSLSSSAAAVFVVIGCLMVFGARTHTLTRSP